MIQDSGNRRQFDTGAVRDIQSNKGRCDLMPLKQIAMYISFESFYEDIGKSLTIDPVSYILTNIDNFLHTGDLDSIYKSISVFRVKLWNISVYDLILEVAIHYEEGANKYGEHNWEKGIPAHCYIDSGVRHLLKFARGDCDEHHDRAFVWNMFGLVWTMQNMPELDDVVFLKPAN